MVARHPGKRYIAPGLCYGALLLWIPGGSWGVLPLGCQKTLGTSVSARYGETGRGLDPVWRGLGHSYSLVLFEGVPYLYLVMEFSSSFIERM